MLLRLKVEVRYVPERVKHTMYLNDIDRPIVCTSKYLAGKSMAVFKQWYRKFEGQYLHSKTSETKANEPKIYGKKANGSKTNENTFNGIPRHGKLRENSIEATVTRLVAASSELNTFLRRQSIPVSSNPGTLDVPLTEENASYHESKSALLDAAERLIALVKGPRDVVLAISFQVSLRIRPCFSRSMGD